MRDFLRMPWVHCRSNVYADYYPDWAYGIVNKYSVWQVGDFMWLFTIRMEVRNKVWRRHYDGF